MNAPEEKKARRLSACASIRAVALFWTLGYWFLLIHVVPTFAMIFEDAGRDLRTPMRILVSICAFTPVERFVAAEVNVILLAIVFFASRSVPDHPDVRGCITDAFLISSLLVVGAVAIALFLPMVGPLMTVR